MKKSRRIPDPRVADLVHAGRVRVAVYLPQYTKDPMTGELKGWPIELIRALGERLGITGVPVEHATPPQAIAGLKAGDCDVAILGIDPTRATEVDYSPAFARLEYTYLVPDRSSIHSIADVDRPGIRIAVVRGHASTLALTRMLKNATLVYAPRAGEILHRARGLARAGRELWSKSVWDGGCQGPSRGKARLYQRLHRRGESIWPPPAHHRQFRLTWTECHPFAGKQLKIVWEATSSSFRDSSRSPIAPI